MATEHESQELDQALVARVQRGDSVAFDLLVRKYQHRVQALIARYIHDWSEVQDVAQDTFIRAWRYAGTYDARRGQVATWLLTIARNAALDRVRLRSATPLDPNVVAAELDRELPDEGTGIAERAHVRGAVAVLPADQRRALVLAMYTGRTAREISELDGVPLGTVKTRIRAAMTKLRATLGVEHGL